MNRILVTGLSGFVGRWLARELSAAPDCEHFALTDPSGNPVDMRDREAVFEAVERLQPTGVVHLAAVAAPAEARGDPDRAWQINVIGTLNLASAIVAKTPSARFVFVGSSECYGESFNRQTGPVHETAALEPTTPYGATKAAADILVAQMARDGLNAIRFRPFNHTGPEQTTSYVVPAFASQIARIERGLQPPVLEVGSLDAERDFLDVRDVVRAYAIAALDAKETSKGAAINLATGRPRQIADILAHLISRSTVKIEVRTDPARVRPNEVPVSAGDNSRALELLGWRPQIPLEKTLDDVLAYWRAHQG